MRTSQMNGCAYCIDMHSKDARALGETEQRLYALDAWRETPFFDSRERAALAWTGAVTRIADGHAPDETFDEVKKHSPTRISPTLPSRSWPSMGGTACRLPSDPSPAGTLLAGQRRSAQGPPSAGQGVGVGTVPLGDSPGGTTSPERPIRQERSVAKSPRCSAGRTGGDIDRTYATIAHRSDSSGIAAAYELIGVPSSPPKIERYTSSGRMLGLSAVPVRRPSIRAEEARCPQRCACQRQPRCPGSRSPVRVRSRSLRQCTAHLRALGSVANR